MDFLKWIESGAVEIVEIKSDDLYRIRKMMDKYQDVPMDFADATLMLISERLKLKEIISLDKDFFVYRKSERSFLNNLLSNMLP